MKINITGDAFVVTSTLSAKDIKEVAKNAPSKLKLYEGEGENKNEVFAISYNEGRPSITSFSLTFGGQTRDEKGLATFTGLIPAEKATDAKNYVADKIAPIVAYLEKLEKDVTKDAKGLRDAREKLVGSIIETSIKVSE